jgi:hypothetical protein
MAERKLSELFDTRIQIGKAEVNWFNRIVLKDVKIEDKNGETALEAGNLTAGFKLWPILKNKWILSTVRLFGVNCHIKKETIGSPPNIQFILDALSGDSSVESNFELRVQSILIRRGSFTYDIMDMENTKRQFNPHHIHVSNISGRLFVDHYSKDSINARINKLSFDEIAGLNVEKLVVNVVGNKDSLHIEQFALILPRTSIRIPSAGIKLAGLDSLSLIADKSPLTMTLAPSQISPADFVAFAPLLKDFSDVFDLSGEITGSINSLALNQLMLNYGTEMSFAGNMYLNNITSTEEELYLFGRAKQLYITTKGLHRISNSFERVNLALPKPVMNLEKLNFTGEISGFIDQMVAFGTLSSPIGSVQMDMLIGHQSKRDTSLYLKGNIASSDLQISSLFEEGNPFGKARFNAEIDLKQTLSKQISGHIRAQINEIEYKNYNYENIFLSGALKENEYEGLIHLNDPNGKAELQGLFRDNGEKSEFDFTANITHLHPDKLNILDHHKYERPDLSLGINAKFIGKNPDDFEGYIEFENVAFSTAKDTFSLDGLRLETTTDEQVDKRIILSSNIINGVLYGHYSFSTLVPDFYETIERYLPSLIRSVRKTNAQAQKQSESNAIHFDFTVENTEKISRTLLLPAALHEKTRLHGQYNNETHTLSATIDAPSFSIGSITLKDGLFSLENADDTINLQIDATQYNKNNAHNQLALKAQAYDDHIQTHVSWTSDKEEQFEADISASALFIEDTDAQDRKKLRTEITIPPAQIILKDSLWNIEPASLTLSDGNVIVDNFYVTKGKQYLHINGMISDDPKERLLIDLNGIEIGHIFEILNKPAIQFGGQATGAINARDLYGSMMIDGRLEVENFSFHKAVQGKLNISSEWDGDRQGILLIGSIYKNDSTYTDVNGYIFPIGDEQGLSLHFDANEINVAFLYQYMKTFSDSVGGRGFGHVHVHGSFSDVTVEGQPYIKDGSVKVNVLNTTYWFSDTIRLEENAIRATNVTIYDKDGDSGKIDFTLQHRHFKELRYDLNIRADKMLAYDITERANPELYGKLYASGTAQLKGTDDFIQVEGNVRTESGTSIGFNFSENASVEDYDFITFTENLHDTTLSTDDFSPNLLNNRKDAAAPTNDTKSDMNYTLDFLVNVTPDAQLELMMDPTTSDKIRGNGNGNLQVQYGSQSNTQIFGNYLISGGSYNFSLQQVIRKRFNIREGSVVSFHGDPMDANLDINAIYNLSANIQDLDETLILETANPNVMINCILQIDGRLQNPTISFDMELPNSNGELERRVKSFIDTEDMMTRQIIYLLVLNKFYTPDYSRNDFRTNEFSAVASSALSAQLSNILNSFTDKVQIGTNIRTRQDGIKDTEVEMLLSSQLLNNRLIFNGNFGYKDNYIQSNAFVGEFDLEYKLTRVGEISLKAYNHANDLYRYSKSLTRQGVGISFRKDFNVLPDIFRRKKKKKDTADSDPDQDANADRASTSVE